MKTVFYLNDKKITRKAAKELAGAERFERMMTEAKEAFMEEPSEQISYMVSGGFLSISFE